MIRSSFICSALFISTLFGVSAQATELEVVKDIIGIHQQDARRILGREIGLIIRQTNEAPNAHASFLGPNNGPLLTYYSSLLQLNEDDDVVTVVCHELGHFLGSRAYGQTQIGNAIESEADYFAGKCGVRYYQMKRGMSLSAAQQEISENARKSFENLYEVRIDPNQARHQVYPGINQIYSPPPCRVLTVIHGAMGWKRPACWYNPNL